MSHIHPRRAMPGVLVDGTVLTRHPSTPVNAPRRSSMADDFDLWDVIVSMMWFFLLIAWIWLFISILADIFRDRSLSGGAKALWTLFLVFLPWIGALVYLIVRGSSMGERSAQLAQERDAQLRAYVKEAAGTPGGSKSVADELKDLAALRDSGVLSPAEYDQAKQKVLT